MNYLPKVPVYSDYNQGSRTVWTLRAGIFSSSASSIISCRIVGNSEKDAAVCEATYTQLRSLYFLGICWVKDLPSREKNPLKIIRNVLWILN